MLADNHAAMRRFPHITESGECVSSRDSHGHREEMKHDSSDQWILIIILKGRRRILVGE